MKVFQYIVFFQIFSLVCSWTPIGSIYNLKSVSRVRIADKDHVVWKSKETGKFTVQDDICFRQSTRTYSFSGANEKNSARKESQNIKTDDLPEFGKDRPMKILIAGGGIGGLVLANALRAKEMDFTIFEKTKQYSPFGGPIQIQSNALAAIEAIDKDMCHEIMAAGTITGNRVNGLKDGKTGKWYCQFDTGAPARKQGLPLTRVVDRPDLQQILLKYLKTNHAFASVIVENSPDLQEELSKNGKTQQLRYGTEVLSYQQDKDGVEVTLADGSVHKGDVLIGADGIWSRVRGQMQNEKHDKTGAVYSGYTCFTGVCEFRPRDVNEVAYKVYLSEGAYFVCSDVGKGRMQWYAMLGQPCGQQTPTLQRKDVLIKKYSGWDKEIIELLKITTEENITQRDLYDRPPQVLKGWVENRVVILGDAAHPMMPNLGQGGCQAIEDAYRVAQELGKCKTKLDIPFALKSYSAVRVGRTASVHGLARIASDVLFYSGLLFKNEWIGNFVSFFMNLSMPFILEFLYQNVLDAKDLSMTMKRLKDKQLYDNDDSMYASVVEAQDALFLKEME